MIDEDSQVVNIQTTAGIVHSLTDVLTPSRLRP